MTTIRIDNGTGREIFNVPGEFAEVVSWLCKERDYQVEKWGVDGHYVALDTERALQGLDEDSWYWQRAVENYVGRVRLFGVTSRLGMQALLKIVSSLISMPEHLMRDHEIDGLPRPGVSSGNE